MIKKNDNDMGLYMLDNVLNKNKMR